eukprot:UN24100
MVHVIQLFGESIFCFIELCVYVICHSGYVCFLIYHHFDENLSGISALITMSMGMFNGLLVLIVYCLRLCYVDGGEPQDGSQTQLMLNNSSYQKLRIQFVKRGFAIFMRMRILYLLKDF